MALLVSLANRKTCFSFCVAAVHPSDVWLDLDLLEGDVIIEATGKLLRFFIGDLLAKAISTVSLKMMQNIYNEDKKCHLSFRTRPLKQLYWIKWERKLALHISRQTSPNKSNY